MTQTDVATLTAKADAAAAKAAAAQEALDKQHEQMLLEQERRGEEWDRRFLDEFDAEQARLEQVEKDARDKFIARLIAEPWAQAWIEMRAARLERSVRGHNAAGMPDQLGVAKRIHPIEPRDGRLLEDLLMILEREAAAVSGDRVDAVTQARQDFVERGGA